MKQLVNCEVCGVSSNEKHVCKWSVLNMYLCDKHKLQYKHHGEFLDKNPRGVFDPNEIRIIGSTAEVDTYDQQGNVIETYTVDAEDVDLIKKYKWRTVYKGPKPYMVTGNQKAPREYFHRLVMNNPENLEVDHISGDSHDNRKSNLRACLPEENALNKQKRSNNTSGIRGVSFNKDEQKWQVDFYVKKKRIYFKKFDSFAEAIYLRYLCEINLLKVFRNTQNDPLFFSQIDTLSEQTKQDIETYFYSKVNSLKSGV